MRPLALALALVLLAASTGLTDGTFRVTGNGAFLGHSTPGSTAPHATAGLHDNGASSPAQLDAPARVPEPGTGLLLGLGLACLATRRGSPRP